MKCSVLLRCFKLFVIIVLASSCVQETRPDNEVIAKVTVQDEWQAQRQVMNGEAQLRPWLAFYQQKIPDLRLGDFIQRDSFAVDTFFTFIYTPDPVFAPLYVFNPSGDQYLDVVSYERTIEFEPTGQRTIVGGSPDNSALLIDPALTTARRLLFCGTPCMFQDAAWLSDTEVAVLGLSSHLNLNFQPTIWYINVPEKEVIIFTHPQEVIPGDFLYIDQQLSKLEAVEVD